MHVVVGGSDAGHQTWNFRTPISLTVVSYGCETWFLIFRKKHRLKTFVKKALCEMFRPNKEKMARGWGKLRAEVFSDLYALLHQISLGMPDNTGRDECSFCVYGTIKHAHRPVVIKREGAKSPDRPGYRWMDKIKS
jgi:hypothetical protein